MSQGQETELIQKFRHWKPLGGLGVPLVIKRHDITFGASVTSWHAYVTPFIAFDPDPIRFFSLNILIFNMSISISWKPLTWR